MLLSNFWFGKLRGTISHCSSLDLSVWVQSQVYLEGLAHRPVHQRSLPQTYRCHVRRRTPFKRLWRPPIGGSGFVGSFSRLSCCLVSAAVCSSLWLTFHHSPRCVLCCSVALPVCITVCMLCSPREWDLLPSVPVVELVQGHCTSQVDLAVQSLVPLALHQELTHTTLMQFLSLCRMVQESHLCISEVFKDSNICLTLTCCRSHSIATQW